MKYALAYTHRCRYAPSGAALLDKKTWLAHGARMTPPSPINARMTHGASRIPHVALPNYDSEAPVVS
jgi:hypothetical protein